MRFCLMKFFSVLKKPYRIEVVGWPGQRFACRSTCERALMSYYSAIVVVQVHTTTTYTISLCCILYVVNSTVCNIRV